MRMTFLFIFILTLQTFSMKAGAQACPGSLPAGIACIAAGSSTDITAFSICEKVINSHTSGKAIMAATNTLAEWNGFRASLPSNGVSLGTCGSAFTPVTQLYSTPGTYSYAVPTGCGSLVIRAWGGGGGGGGDSGGAQSAGGNGGTSSATYGGTTYSAGGGFGGATAATGNAGAGGTTPTSGDYNFGGAAGGSGASFGGYGGPAAMVGADTPNLTGTGTPSASTNFGVGGGASCAGGGFCGGGGGGGSFMQKTIAVSGGTVTVVVGAAGTAGGGNGPGAAGGVGRVVLDCGATGFNVCGDSATVGIGAICNGNQYAGSLNGSKYMTTLNGCTSPPATATCAGGVTIDLSRAYAANDGRTPTAHTAATGATSTTDGAANTALLVPYADTDMAKYCDALVYGGYSDWFLPAKDEAAQVATTYGDYFVYGTRGPGESNFLPSSTQTPGNGGYYTTNGSQISYNSNPFRCMRKF